MTAHQPDPSGTAASKPRRYYPELQILRGLAATMVVMIHSLVAWQPLTREDPVGAMIVTALRVVISGNAPVILFFVLSGFVLSESLSRSASPLHMVSGFYVRRIFRIMPGAIAVLLVTAAMLGSANELFSPWARAHLAPWITGPLQAARLAELPNGLLLLNNNINPMYWTIQVEAIGSILLPFLYLSVSALPRQWRTFGVAGFVAVGLMLPTLPYQLSTLSPWVTHGFLFCFPLGMLVHIFVRVDRTYWHGLASIVGWIGLLILLLAHNAADLFGGMLGESAALILVFGHGENIALYLSILAEAAGAAMLVGAVVVYPAAWKMIRSRMLDFLGRVSYSLYLFHFSVLVLVCVIVDRVWQAELAQSPWLAPFVMFAFGFPVSIGFATAIFAGIEKRGVDAGHMLSRALTRLLGGAPVTQVASSVAKPRSSEVQL